METLFKILRDKMVISDEEKKFCKDNFTELIPLVKNPIGMKGRIISRYVGVDRKRMTQWAFSRCPFEFNAKILEIGYGAGYLIQGIAETIKKIGATGKIYGIDYSRDMLIEASERNKQFIKEGIVSLYEKEVSQMDVFSNDLFDFIIKITSINFWSHIVEDLKEVHRVLKPNGRFIVVDNRYEDSRFKVRNEKNKRQIGMNIYKVSEFKDFFRTSGFKSIKIETQPIINWILICAQK